MLNRLKKLRFITVIILIVVFSTPICSMASTKAAVDLSGTTDQQEAIKQTINSYFNSYYKSLGNLEVEQNYRSFFGDQEAYDEQLELLDTTIEFRKMQGDSLSFEQYFLDLDFENIEIKENDAVVRVVENSSVYFSGWPDTESKLAGKVSVFTVVPSNGQWLITELINSDEIKTALQDYKQKAQMGYRSGQSAKEAFLQAERERFARENASTYTPVVVPYAAGLKSYQRSSAVSYAKANALKSTISGFGNFESYDGDCTNFVSACLYNGGIPMDTNGGATWFYYGYSDKERAPSWTSASYFRTYLKSNNSSSTSNAGMYATSSNLRSISTGDVAQASGHSVIVTKATYTSSGYYDHLICQRSTSVAGRKVDYPLSSVGGIQYYFVINGYY